MNMKIIVSLLVLACCEAARPSLEQQVDRMAARLGRLEAELAAKDERIAALEAAEATQAGWYECAWREEWTGTYLDHSNITYETLVHSSTGGGAVGGAGLNITTGIFTAPYSGVWTVREGLVALINPINLSSSVLLLSDLRNLMLNA